MANGGGFNEESPANTPPFAIAVASFSALVHSLRYNSSSLGKAGMSSCLSPANTSPFAIAVTSFSALVQSSAEPFYKTAMLCAESNEKSGDMSLGQTVCSLHLA
ncbi:hypothetical protein AC1031_017279 [Aphanomyces cochlioides]|nr:hypothetical protein AC1031_017279 [Aphanomyces cochlioides]